MSFYVCAYFCNFFGGFLGWLHWLHVIFDHFARSLGLYPGVFHGAFWGGSLLLGFVHISIAMILI